MQDALSYTSGGFTTYGGAEPCFPIICNDKTPLVIPHLYDALLQLHNIQYGPLREVTWSDEDTGPVAGAKLFPDPPPEDREWPTGLWEMQDLLWVDAICINQAELEEKSVEVRVMGGIYTSAIIVLVWLGKPDEATEVAPRVVSQLPTVPKEIYKHLRAHDILEQDSYAKLGIPMITTDQWKVFMMLMGRRWFDRVSTMQEAMLARYMGVVCDPHEISWHDLVRSSGFIDKSTWSAPLSELPGVNEEDTSISRCQKGASPSMLSLGRESLIQGKGLFQGLDVLQSLEAMILLARPKQSADPRDKVYAILWFVHTSSPATDPGKKTGLKRIMVPDYTKSTQDVYLEAVALVLKGSGNLQILSSVEDVSCRTIEGLPSWVPNLSALQWPPALIPHFRSGHRYCPWRAAGDQRSG